MAIAFNVFNCWTGSVQFTAQIECAEDTPTRLKRGLAVEWAFRRGADLRGADLRGAVLRDADLSGADLRGADLRGADVVFAGIDARGYEFYLTADKAAKSIIIRAGCRRWTSFAEARAHYGADYINSGDVTEIMAKLAMLEAVARHRGYLPD